MGEGKVQKNSETWKKDGQHCYLVTPVITHWGIEAQEWSVAPLAATVHARDSCET